VTRPLFDHSRCGNSERSSCLWRPAPPTRPCWAHAPGLITAGWRRHFRAGPIPAAMTHSRGGIFETLRATIPCAVARQIAEGAGLPSIYPEAIWRMVRPLLVPCPRNDRIAARVDVLEPQGRRHKIHCAGAHSYGGRGRPFLRRPQARSAASLADFRRKSVSAAWGLWSIQLDGRNLDKCLETPRDFRAKPPAMRPRPRD